MKTIAALVVLSFLQFGCWNENQCRQNAQLVEDFSRLSPDETEDRNPYYYRSIRTVMDVPPEKPEWMRENYAGMSGLYCVYDVELHMHAPDPRVFGVEIWIKKPDGGKPASISP